MTLVPLARVRTRAPQPSDSGVYVYRGVLHDGSRFVFLIAGDELRLARIGDAAVVRSRLLRILEAWVP